MHDLLQHDNETFRRLIEAAPDGILLVATDGRIAFANSACERIFEYERGELIGQLVEVVVPDYIRSKHAGLRDQYFAGPHSRPMGMGLDLVAARKDGSTIPVEISLSPVEFKGRTGVIAVVRDVSEQRRLTKELKRSNEELGQFAYVASHDLQEPLRIVSGYTQLLKRHYADKLDDEAKEYIEYAVDGAKRMQGLIQDLLAYSRLSTSGKAFVLVDLNDVVQQATVNLRVTIEEVKAKLTIAKLPTVVGDRTQLIQLCQNLLSNALKFHRTGVDPSISISSSRDGADWNVSVSDNGIGVEAEYQERIFVIFQRLHPRETYSGTGIGLAICKKVVERHGGRIWFESTVGQGTTFYFTIPATEIES